MEDVKEKKAPGSDGIPNEAWIYGGEDLVNKLICILGQIWDGADIPRRLEDWSYCAVIQKGGP